MTCVLITGTLYIAVLISRLVALYSTTRQPDGAEAEEDKTSSDH